MGDRERRFNLENEGEATTRPDSDIQKIWETKEWPRSGHGRSSYIYQLKASSSKVITIVPSALSAIPARSFSEISSTDSRPRLRNCWQKNKLVLDQAGAQ